MRSGLLMVPMLVAASFDAVAQSQQRRPDLPEGLRASREMCEQEAGRQFHPRTRGMQKDDRTKKERMKYVYDCMVRERQRLGYPTGPASGGRGRNRAGDGAAADGAGD